MRCNVTVEESDVGSELKLVGSLTFHHVASIVAAACAAIAILVSFYLMCRHATNYTKPNEQKHVLRILFMIPIYATGAFLSLYYYRKAVYLQVMTDCYEAFAICSWFGLMSGLVAPDLSQQKDWFRNLPADRIKPWVWPVTWFKRCCGGERGPWRTPKSGLTWFNIIWISIYHYCFIRVAMTITAVITQYYGQYCESSNSPVFAHVWVLIIEGLAVSVAMYALIQFYLQLKEPLAEHKPFLKVLAIKLIIFLVFWQNLAISFGTSTLHIVEANELLAYPDIKIGIPSLLLCFEMAVFSILHLFAFPYAPYVPGAKQTFYPVPDPSLALSACENEHGERQGGFAGLLAIADALNAWDIVKAFGRGMRWLFVGIKHRKQDPSYKPDLASVSTAYPMKTYDGATGPAASPPDRHSTHHHLPLYTEPGRSPPPGPGQAEESAGLMKHAQDLATPAAPPVDTAPDQGRYYRGPAAPSVLYRTEPVAQERPRPGPGNDRHADPASYAPYRPPRQHRDAAPGNGARPPRGSGSGGDSPAGRSAPPRPNRHAASSAQVQVGNALWGGHGSPPQPPSSPPPPHHRNMR